jgi:hypothetical protein
MDTNPIQRTKNNLESPPSGFGFADSTLIDRSSLEEAIASLREVNTQLVTALETRVVIEQAKGILAERYRLDLDEAFLLLRFAARSNRSNLRTLAAAIIRREPTPKAVTDALARPERWRRTQPHSRNQRF